jgi:hypothetical protein
MGLEAKVLPVEEEEDGGMSDHHAHPRSRDNPRVVELYSQTRMLDNLQRP